MSFGWSAGDIAQAISLIVKVVKALDDGSGAPDEYRKMAVFLENVNLTLKNLHVFATLGVYPSYGDEIRRQIENIRPPLERFLNIMKKFEPHLGSNATPGWWKNIPQKMLWTFKRSHHKLKKEIKEHLFMLDNILDRFTLEVVLTLPDELKQLFINTLTPQMISALEGMINPVRNEISLIRSERREQHKELHSKAEEIILLLQSLKMDDSKPENNGALDAVVHNIKEHITSMLGTMSNNPQIPIIDSCPRRAYNTESPPASNVLFQATNRDPLEASDEEIKQSLRNIYYSIILYAGMFLRNLWSDNAALTADTWSHIVKPGCHIEMAMLLDFMGTVKKRFPSTRCPGVLTNVSGSTWKKCSSCRADILESKVAGANQGVCLRSLQGTIDRFKVKESRTFDAAVLAQGDNRLLVPPAESAAPQPKGLLKQQHKKFEFQAPFSTTESEDSSRPTQTELKSNLLAPALSLEHALELQDNKLELSMDSSSRSFKNISESQNKLESNTESPTMQSGPDSVPQHTKLESDTELSTQPFVIASGSWKSRVFIWSCCCCRDYSGNYTSSGMTAQLMDCPTCSHLRCSDCPVEWVKIRSYHHDL
ncbi:hypothetical protein BPAE_0034g00080 [Botrytis paeoniae]|uniref:Fungal N-terminal domain-containing protein n=1 Tax=Botrytis paeoniae TaxID=278948 RepID=A0A4Z1FYG8_9HELO|nr:hypothetical protein BPAE_0034g00080 [Botrytis paeoniae]